MHKDIERLLKEKGETWMVAAMVEGSIGYHAPDEARRKISRYQEGERQDFCERCYCCYGADLEKMLLSDATSFERTEKDLPEKVKRIITYCEAWEKVAAKDPLNSVGLMYPGLSL